MNQELNRFISVFGSQRIAADAVGVTPATINLLLHRKRDFSAAMLRRIKRVFPAVSYDALLEPGLAAEDDQQD